MHLSGSPSVVFMFEVKADRGESILDGSAGRHLCLPVHQGLFRRERSKKQFSYIVML